MNQITLQIEKMDELINAINKLNTILGGQSVQQPAQAVPVQQVVPVPPVQQAVTPAAPVQQQPAAPTVPTTTKEYTLDELGAAGASVMQTVGIPKLTELIQSFGVKSLQELPKEHYGAFALKLRELGAHI